MYWSCRPLSSLHRTIKLCGANEAQRSLRPNERIVYAQHGRELMGLKPLYVNLSTLESIGEILDEGNCGRATARGKEAGE